MAYTEAAARILRHNIIKLRESHQYSMTYVAEQLDIGQPSISKLEAGDIWPKPHIIDKLANLYKISIADLFSPRGAADKAFSIAATEEHMLDGINSRLRESGYELKRVRTR